MPETKYTQGPWGPYGNPYSTLEELWTPSKGAMEVSPGLTIGSIRHSEPICRVFGYLLPAVANARLIVAAPDLLEAIVADGDNSLEIIKVASWKRAIAAIAKARRRPSSPGTET